MCNILRLALLIIAAALSGCATPHNPEEDPDSFEAVKDIHGGPFSDMMLVYLKTGPNKLTEENFKGHMANMQRLADAGVLLIAGPFASPRDKDWRGIFVLDTSSVQLAQLQAETDPGVKSGAFVLEYQPIKASISLRSTGDLEKAMLARNAAAGDAAAKDKDATKPPPNLRSYVMITADDAAAATSALARAGLSDKVVWCGKFSARAGNSRGAVVVLDATKVDDVKAKLETSGVGTKGLGLDAWMSTASLMGLDGAAHRLP